MTFVKVSKQAAKKLSVEIDELQKSVSDATVDVLSVGIPVELVVTAFTGKSKLKLGKNSVTAKVIYKSVEFRTFLDSITASQCLKAPIRFDKTKALHAAFQDATLFGDISVEKGMVHFRGHLYDEFDFRKSKNAKVKNTFGKLLRELGNNAKKLQDAGITKPFKIFVELEHKMKRK